MSEIRRFENVLVDILRQRRLCPDARIVRSVTISNANSVGKIDLRMRLDALDLAKQNCRAHARVEQTDERFRRTKTVDNPTSRLWTMVIACSRVQSAISDGSELET